MTRRRALVAATAVVCVLLALAGATALLAYNRIGRTPGELIDYAQRRLQGHNKLEAVAVPVLEALRRWMGEPGAADWAAPFVVPPLQPNPAASRTPASAPTVGQQLPQDASAKIIRVGPGRSITSIGVAAKLAEDGSTIEIDPGDYYADVAVLDRAELTLRGTGPRVRLIAAGQSAEGKAIWVIRRGRVTVEGIDFIGARVADRNGAGIRFEGGHLVVRRCTFTDNENGILTTASADARLEIENSEFGYNGGGEGLSHGVYVGAIAYLRISGSYFHHANVGHLIKSRAKVNRIEYNRITDESGGRASYELEFANGGVAEVVGNIIQQGQDTRNSVIVSYGVEGYVWPENRLALSFNTVVNDRRWGGSFVRVAGPVASRAGDVVVRNNLFVGAGLVGVPLADAGGNSNSNSNSNSNGNYKVGWDVFVRAARGDYRLTDSARGALAAQPSPAGVAALVPRAEYQHPMRTRALPGFPRWAGALQEP